MLRFCLIVICSIGFTHAGLSQSASWSRGNNINPSLSFDPGSYVGYAEMRVPFVHSGGTHYFVVNNGGSFTFFSFSSGAGTAYANSSPNFNAFQSQFPYNSSGPAEFRLMVDGQLSDWMTELEDTETRDFQWSFPASWAGVVVEVRDSSGEVLWSGIVPEGGGDLAGSVTASPEVLEGASVYFDGYPASTPTWTGSEAAPGDFGVERPGYAVGFDSSYYGQEWTLQRPDGTVIATGYVTPDGDYVTTGWFTTGTDLDQTPAEFYTRWNTGDGPPGEWEGTGVTVGGNEVTYHSFVNNPDPAPVDPMPTPAPVSSPMPTPVSPTNASGSPGVVTNPTNSEEYVTVDVGSAELPGTDDGEGAVINGIGEISGLMQGIVGDMAQAQSNLVAASEQFKGLRIGGVGSKCSFQMGPASINLQTSGTARTGLTLLVIGIAGFAAASMLRNAVQ